MLHYLALSSLVVFALYTVYHILFLGFCDKSCFNCLILSIIHLTISPLSNYYSYSPISSSIFGSTLFITSTLIMAGYYIDGHEKGLIPQIIDLFKIVL